MNIQKCKQTQQFKYKNIINKYENQSINSVNKLINEKVSYNINKFNLFSQIRMAQNPQLGIMTPRTMYEYDHHMNIPWNDVQYNPVREYLDPNRQMTQRKYQQAGKGGKDTKYVTKKGFYMDYHLKVVKALPAPSLYNLKDPLDQADNHKKSKFRKIDSSLSKYTYIDRIQIEQKNRKKPAPGSYNLNKTDSQIKQEVQKMKTKKKSHGPKRYFFEDSQYLSNLHPGAGAQNPHLSVDHLKLNKTTHKFWIDKHKKQNQYWRKKRASTPGPMSYSPCHIDYESFQKIASTQKVRKKKQSKTGFGTDAKFTYDRPSKKKILEVRPEPSKYKMQIQWKGKDMDSKKNNWIRTRSTGFTHSVYN